jgi:hypothetical protein
MDRCLSRAVSGLRHDNEADEDNEVDTGVVVDEPTDEADREAIKRLVDSQVDERTNEIDHVASEGGNVEFQSHQQNVKWFRSDNSTTQLFWTATLILPEAPRSS